jgi:hypothetical protein
MNQRYVFIDESGDLGKEKGSKYFVITAIWTDKPELFDRIIKNARRNKFKKELKKASEIKANKSSKELVEWILKKFANLEATHGQCVILEKSKLFSKYLDENKDKLYNFVAGNLKNIGIDSKNLIIRVDRSKGKQNLIDDFNIYIDKKFKEVRWNREIKIHHSWSHGWSGLQIADIASWAVFRKYEFDDDSFFKIIEKKVNISHMWE